MNPLVSIENLVVRFSTPEGPIHAVNDVDIKVFERETVGVVGESGSGKTVMTLAILGLLPRRSAKILKGTITLQGRDITNLGERELRKLRGREVAFIFQDPMTSLNPVLRIGEQVTEAIRAHASVSPTEARSRGAALLGDVGIPDPDLVMSRYPHQLSGGMRQRVMIAIAIALKPRLIIADEPTTALDVTIQAQVLELLRDVTSQTGVAAVLISHDLGIVAGMTQRVYVMYAGTVVETGPTREVFERPMHPYTVGLLHSIPSRAASAGSRLIPIDGVPPDMRSEVVGCPFAPRCRWRLRECWTVRPTLREGSPGHAFACHNPPTAEEAIQGTPLAARASDPGAGRLPGTDPVDSVARPPGEASPGR